MHTTPRPSVLAAFRAYSEKLEGRTRFPYLDVKGLVTVSVGCLIDAPAYLFTQLTDNFGRHRRVLRSSTRHRDDFSG